MDNLRPMVGDRYRIVRGKPSPGEEDDALFGQPEARQRHVPCAYGTIFAGFSGGLRAFTGNRRIVPRLADIPGAVQTHCRWERGGHVSELTIAFPPESLGDVADVLKARLRRQIDPEVGAALAAKMRAAKELRASQ